MAKPTADEFIAALRRVEEGESRDAGAVDAIVALFADDARISNPTSAEPHRGVDGARAFWRDYRESFTRVRSRFHTKLEGDDRAVLEWTSDVETAAGASTSYDGVSVFETRGGRIVRFTAYFDPAQLSATPSPTRPDAAHRASGSGAYGAVTGESEVASPSR